jgi:hypothetical protein
MVERRPTFGATGQSLVAWNWVESQKPKKTYGQRRVGFFVISKSRWRRAQAWRPCGGSGLRKSPAFAECSVPRQWQKWREEDDRRGRLSIRTISLGKREKFFQYGGGLDCRSLGGCSPVALRGGASTRGQGCCLFQPAGRVTFPVPSLPSSGVRLLAFVAVG